MPAPADTARTARSGVRDLPACLKEWVSSTLRSSKRSTIRVEGGPAWPVSPAAGARVTRAWPLTFTMELEARQGFLRASAFPAGIAHGRRYHPERWTGHTKSTGMSEGVGFVNTALLGEEQDQGSRALRHRSPGPAGARHRAVSFDFHN